MKKVLLSLIALLGVGVCAFADGTWTVSNINIPQGKTAVAEVYLTDGSTQYRDFQCDVVLPDGLTFVKAGKGSLITSNPDNQHGIASNAQTDGSQRIVCNSNAGDKFSGTSAPFLLLTLQANADVAIGTVLSVTIKNIEITTDTEKQNPASVSFNVTVEDAVKVLDENSTSLPEATTTPYTVKVNRTIYANEWSTLCLPFAMNAQDLVAAFGDDVQLADFIDYDATEDAAGNVTAINVNFESIPVSDGLKANYPCLIRTTQDVTDFTLETAISPDAGNAKVEYRERKNVYGTFYGTLKAGNAVPTDNLFLSGNKFFYSTGDATIKAFRGYFSFVDVLSSTDANARLSFSIDGETTRINGLSSEKTIDGTYTIDGKRISADTERLQRGIYIQNGKKVVK